MLNCIIIDDDPVFIKILEDYISRVPLFNKMTVCTNYFDAYEFLHLSKTDIIFLNIHLSGINGTDFLYTLVAPPPIIIIANDESFALESYEVNVVDYLLKPFEFNRFIKTTDKIKAAILKTKLADRQAYTRQYHFFCIDNKMVKIYLDDILYVESVDNHIKIVTEQKQLITKSPLNEIERIFGNQHFIKPHHSYLVSYKKITAYSKQKIEISEKVIPISRIFRERVLAFMERN